MRTGFVTSLDLPREWGLRAVLDTNPHAGSPCGQGHLQPAGGRHPPVDAQAGRGAEEGSGRLGRAGGV